MKKDRGSGSAVRLITGYSMYGTDLLIAPEDLEKATALMDALFEVEDVVHDGEDGKQ